MDNNPNKFKVGEIVIYQGNKVIVHQDTGGLYLVVKDTPNSVPFMVRHSDIRIAK